MITYCGALSLGIPEFGVVGRETEFFITVKNRLGEVMPTTDADCIKVKINRHHHIIAPVIEDMKNGSFKVRFAPSSEGNLPNTN